MKQLIVTADDVGLHRGMTDGAIKAHQDGIVTACSIVPNGAAFEHAVERLHDFSGLEVGVHLTLVEERPLSLEAGSLTARNGLFHENYVAFVPHYLLRRVSMDEVEREFRTQIEAVLDTGLGVTHLNGHQHLHLLPRIFDVVYRLAEEYGIGYVRIVDERCGREISQLRGLSIDALSALGRRARGRSTVHTNDHTIGVGIAGHLRDLGEILPLLDRVDGVTELVCHPGLGEDMLSWYTWGYEWEAETRALCDPRLRGEIAARGITLTAPGALRASVV